MNRVNIWISKRPTGKKRKRKSGLVDVYKYRLQWRDPDTGRVRTETVGTDSVYAEDMLKRRRAELEAGHRIGVKVATFKEFMAEHLERVKNSKELGTYRNHRHDLETFMEICQPKNLLVVDYNMLEKYRDTRTGQGLAPATVHRELSVLRNVFRLAVARGYLAASPFQKVTAGFWPRIPKAEVVTVSDDEYKAIIAACPNNQWRAICDLGFHAGLRIGEAISRQWSDIDFDNEKIYVRSNDYYRMKTDEARAVDMNEHLRRSLELMQRQMLTGGLVFKNRNGGYFRSSPAAAQFKRIVTKADLVDDNGEAKYTFHKLRKSFGTTLAMANTPPKVLMELLGHSKIETTMSYYVKATDEEKRRAVDLLVPKIG